MRMEGSHFSAKILKSSMQTDKNQVASFLSTHLRKKRASLRLALFFQLNPSAVGIANCSDWDQSHYRGMKSFRDEIRLRRDRRTDFISSAGPKTRRAPKRGKHPRVQVGHSEIAKPMPPPRIRPPLNCASDELAGGRTPFFRSSFSP